VTQEQVARYWAKIKKGPSCWEWTAFRDAAGYGRMRLGPIHKRGHQIAWFLAHGEWVPLVLHNCDNPPCCNPDHLYAGTYADNNRDMENRGRMSRGSRHYNAKLTEDSVRELKSLRANGWTMPQLASKYGVAMGTVQCVLDGRRWRHVR
jgi:hypothetical protein